MGKWNVTLEDGRKVTINAPSADQAQAAALKVQSLPVVGDVSLKGVGQDISDAMRVGVDTAGFGSADAGLGLFNDPAETARQRQLTQEARGRLGWAAPVVDFAAGMAGPNELALVKNVGKAGRTLISGASGGIQAGLDAYGHGKDWGEIGKEAVVGTGLGTAFSAVADPISSWWSRRQGRNKALQTQQYKDTASLEKGKNAAYDKVKNAGVSYDPATVTDLQNKFKRLARDERMVPKGDKKSFTTMKETLEDMRTREVTPADVDVIRARVREVQKTNQANRKGRHGREMVKKIDEWATQTPVTKPPVSGIGPRAPAPQTVKADVAKSRDLNARLEREKLINEIAANSYRRTMGGRFDPFSPSAESMSAKGFTNLEHEALAGDLKSKFTKDELAKIHDISTGGSKPSLRNIGGRLEPYSFGGQALPKWAKIGSAGILPTGAQILASAGRKATKNRTEDLGALIRDPTGKGVNVPEDPDFVNAVKERIASMMVQGYRASTKDYPEKK